MASRPVRTFAPAHGLSPKAAVLAVAAAVAIAGTLGFAARANTNAERDHAAEAARKIMHAADAYAASSAQAGCPTISELLESRALDETARTEDAWGNRFRIVCDGAGTRIVSGGPDGRLGTSDDIRFTH